MSTHEGRFQQLAFTATEWVANDAVVRYGEMAASDVGSSTPVLKIGDGVRPFSALPNLMATVDAANDYVAGPTTTLPPGSAATVTIDNTVDPPTISFGIPAGAPGDIALGNPTALIELTAINGSSLLAMRSDAAPALNQAITPTWSGAHTFSVTPVVPDDSWTYAKIQNVSASARMLGRITAAAGDIEELTGTQVVTLLDVFTSTLKGVVPASGGGTANFLRADGTFAVPPGSVVVPVAANPTAVVGLTAINGSAATFMRSDAAPALNQAIAPTWTGAHTFSAAVDLAGLLKAAGVEGISGQVLSSQGAGLPPVWRTSSGGSIELGWNFSTAVGTANPGSQKMSLNSAVYSTVTTAVFNALAMTNFDANTILSLLRPGNRIYIQQRNDASKAVVYEVTANASNMTGYWTVPVSMVNSLGAMFAANADLNVVFILSTSASSSANPTALVGLAAINGSASTWMRSDAAPALNQAITPTWTGTHDFTKAGIDFNAAVRVVSTAPAIFMQNSAAPTNERNWSFLAQADGSFIGRTLSDDGSTAIHWLTVNRVGTSLDSITLNASLLRASGNLQVAGGVIYLTADRLALVDLSDGYLRLNNAEHYANGIYAPGNLRAGGYIKSDVGFGNVDLSKYLQWESAAFFGGVTLSGAKNGYHGLNVFNGASYLSLMNAADGTSAGLYFTGDGNWVVYRINSTTAGSQYSFTAPSFNSSSARALKRETGVIGSAAHILARLRPLLYKLLADGDDAREQLGLIAEEVHEICPQLSDGKSVAYDRLALLLLADWQNERCNR